MIKIGIKKTELFIGMFRGLIVGSFIKTESVRGEDDMVDIHYVPLGALRTRILKSIPEKAIFSKHYPKETYGSQGKVVIAIEDAKGESYLKDWTDQIMATITEYKDKLAEEKIATRAATYKASESAASMDRQKKKEIERTRRSSSFSFGNQYGQSRFDNDGPTRESQTYLEDIN